MCCTTTYQECSQTVMVPEWVTETRKVCCTEYTEENRERKYQVCKLVPHKEMKTEKYFVCVPEKRQKEVEYTVCVPEKRQREVEYTVCVPEKRQKEVQYTVCETEMRSREERYTVCKPVWTEKEEEFCVMVPHTEKRQGTRCVMKPVWEEKEVKYTVCVPVTETRKGTRMVQKCVQETVMNTVCEDQGQWEERTHTVNSCCTDPCTGCPVPCTTTCTYKVWVPKIVEKQVPCTVNKMVCVPEEYEYQVTTYKQEQRTRWSKFASASRKNSPTNMKSPFASRKNASAK